MQSDPGPQKAICPAWELWTGGEAGHALQKMPSEGGGLLARDGLAGAMTGPGCNFALAKNWLWGTDPPPPLSRIDAAWSLPVPLWDQIGWPKNQGGSHRQMFQALSLPLSYLQSSREQSLEPSQQDTAGTGGAGSKA